MRRSWTSKDVSRLGFVLVLILAGIFAVYFLLDDPQTRTIYMDVVSVGVELGVGTFLLGAAWALRWRSGVLAGTWIAIGSAILTYAAGDISWAYLELALEHPPFPSVADLFYLLYYPVFFLGAMHTIRGRISPHGKFNLGLDLATVFVSAALVFWNLLIQPVVQSTSGSPLFEQIILWAYPVGDLILLAALVLLLYFQLERMDVLSTLILAVAISVMVIADSIYAYQTLAGTYVSGGPINLAWLTAHGLTGLAFLPQMRLALVDQERPLPLVPEAYLVALRSIRTYLPYGSLMVAYILLLRAGVSRLWTDPLTLGLGLGLIVLLVILRQVTTISENTTLTDELVAKAAELEHTNRYLAVEVTERKRIEEKLSYDTLHDNMTGLPNRALFRDVLSGAIKLTRNRRKARSFSVLFIDIDHFKVVNDSLGHMVGDELLWAIGARLKGSLRSIDTLARFGGDEFAILMDTTDQGDAIHGLADRVQRSLQQAFRIEGHELHMSASIGVVANVGNYEQAEDLLRDADLAMYEAKSTGKSRFQSFNVAMRKRAFLRLDLESELRKGLANGEIYVYYQPIVSLKTGRACGIEALARWHHPERGLLRPKDFLTVAEESGLIVRMGDQVLATACEEMTHAQERFPALAELGVSVNISNKQFTQPGLVASVGQSLRRTGLQPRALKLEITERVLIENLRLANRIFNDLNTMGVRFDIDDFGTGYSALTYLQRFPIHALKIDQGFIESMHRSRKGLGLVRAIVAMAHELGMETVAEGIATRGQLNDLKALDCDYGQGQLISKPLPSRGLENFLGQSSANGRRPGMRAASRRKQSAKPA